MKKLNLIIGILCILCLLVLPAQAFTNRELTVNVAANGDAHVTVRYELSFVEQFAVFLKIADPSAELRNAFENNFQKPVTVSKADNTVSEVMIPSFAGRSVSGNALTLTTPSLSFARAEAVMNQYWFAPLVSPDFSPAVTTIIFPDGYREVFYDQISIPSVNHKMGTA